MARDRLLNSNNQYGDHSAPGNPYAQSGGGGGYGQQAFGQQDQYSDGGGGGGDFWGDMNNVNALLQELKQKIEAVRQAHQSTLTSTDGSTIAYADQLSEDARQSREQCKNAIKRLAKAAKGNKSYKTQVDTVNKTFRDLLQDHQRVEQDYRKATKDRAVRQYKIVKPDATPQEIENVMSNDNPQVFAQALLNTNAYGAARGAYREVQERHTEILKIEKSMTELAQMMNEMSVLVEQQDEAIQVVQTNAENTHMDIDKGNVELDGAIKKAQAARRKKWICFWIMVVILIIIAIVVGIAVAKATGKI